MNRRCFMFHKDLAPKGKVFDEAVTDMAKLASEGWVDNKGKIDGSYPEYPQDTLETESLPGRDDMADDEGEQGSDDQDSENDGETPDPKANEKSDDMGEIVDLLAVFHANPIKLTREELLFLGESSGIKMKKNWKEQTMISAIQKGLKDGNN